VAENENIRRAGRTLIRQARTERLRFVRRNVGLLALISLVYAAVSAIVILTGGGHRPFLEGALIVGYVWLWWAFIQLDRSRNRVDGAHAEQWTAGRLRRARRQGWSSIDDVPFEGFNVDHVWFGARGVIAIETKYTSYTWTVAGTGLTGPLPTEHPLDQARAGARKIRLLLKSYGIEVRVLPALAVWDQVRPRSASRWTSHFPPDDEVSRRAAIGPREARQPRETTASDANRCETGGSRIRPLTRENIA
jgi:hypothetical protein